MKILLFEDNRADARLFEIFLGQIDSGEDHQLICANTLASGLEELNNVSNTFDLIFTDLELPDSFGLETLNQVLARSGDVPIIVLTGDDAENRARKMIDHGAADCLSKNSLDENQLKRTLAETAKSAA